MKRNANLWMGLAVGALLAPTMAMAQVTTPPNGGNGTPTPAPTAPTTSPSDTPTTAPVTADLATYRLDTGDSVMITVDRHGDVSRTVTLLADATVMLPRMQKNIDARGMTCEELGDAVFNALNKPTIFKLRREQVNVALTGQRMRHVYVRGNTVHGGDYDLKNGWRVTELVAVMGGVPQPDRVRVMLTNPKRPAPISVDLNAALDSESSPANIPLMEGDTLVFEGPRQKIFFVQGEGPRGKQEVDERFTMKQALVAIGVTYNNQSGEFRKATLIRHTVPGDPTSPVTKENVDLVKVLNDDNFDHDLKDYDTVFIPLSLRYYYVWGELGGARKRWLPEDRATRLVDVMSDSGNTTTGQAKIGDVQIIRGMEASDKPQVLHYDYGKFLRSGDQKYNPVIEPGDLVVVPNVKRTDPVSTIWTSFGLYNLAKTFIGGLP